MMAIVLFVVGNVVAAQGWRARQYKDEQARQFHRLWAPLLLTFIALGYVGGVWSLVLQHKRIMHSPHFWTGTVAVVLLALNGAISLSGFLGNQDKLRTFHAVFGVLVLSLLFVHAAFGVRLGLALNS
ncbi:DUF4079 domain-containing protein [Leptolyngbya sp. FACHB-261]|nr:DUF4079 domain-containing protein [Leptolyngbya sp. FACHB-261]